MYLALTINHLWYSHKWFLVWTADYRSATIILRNIMSWLLIINTNLSYICSITLHDWVLMTIRGQAKILGSVKNLQHYSISSIHLKHLFDRKIVNLTLGFNLKYIFETFLVSDSWVMTGGSKFARSGVKNFSITMFSVSCICLASKLWKNKYFICFGRNF